MKTPFKYLSLFLIFLYLHEGVWAQDKKIRFKHYSIDHGLSQNTVFSLLEDKDGLIWAGTEDGLNKFDSYTFTSYKHKNKDPRSISHNQINDLYEDKNGKIWVATSNGLNIFDKRTETFELLPVPKDQSAFITSIFEDKKGNIWVTTLNGLLAYHPAKKTFSHFSFLNNRRADKVMEDATGIFWVSVDKDLRRFDPKTKKFIPLPPLLENNPLVRNSYPRVIKEDHSKRIWVGTEESGLLIYDPKTNTLQHFENDKSNKNSLPVNIVRDIYFNKEEAWLGTRNGLSILDPETKTFTNYQSDEYDDSSLSENSVRTILKDRAGNMWLGTFGGGLNLVTLHHNLFSYIGAKTVNKPGISYKMASALGGATNGGLWIGTEGGGINFVSADFSSFRSYALPRFSANIAVNTIKCLLPDGPNLWVGTFKGLEYFNSATGELKDVLVPENRGVASIVKIGDQLWLGTNGEGLICRESNGKTTVFKSNDNDPNSLSRNNIFKVVKDKQNNLWIATNNGLNYFNHKKFKQYLYDKNDPYSISSSSVSTLLIDSKNRLWAGTKGGGLNLFDKKSGRFYVIDQSLGLANDAIQAIEEDNKGNLWVSTNNGLSKIRVTGPPPFSNQSVFITNYFLEDGLQSNQFLINSSYRNTKGELFFGGINGVTYFHPDHIQKNQYQPPVIFTEFMIRNKTVTTYDKNSPLKQAINETEEITLSYDQAFISIKFAALNYVNPIKNQYAYKLEGFKNDDDWHFVENQRIATYTNLDAGTYYFKVKAANNDGVWNHTPKTLKITVLPPWWKTWWAYTLYAVAIITLLYLYYSYSIKTTRLKSDLAYEHLIREKDHELYHRKLNFFTNISHEIKTPLTLILAPLDKLLTQSEGNNRIQHQVMLMKRNGERLVRLINQLLDFRKFESGNMQLRAAEGNIVRFTKEVVFAFDAYASHLDIKLEVLADKKSIRVWFDRDKFEKILYNLLSNALKFTKPGGKITVKVKETAPDKHQTGYAIVEVEDNGIGISADKIYKIFDQFEHFNEEGVNLQGSGIGLAFTKGLVELHHGEISVESTPETKGQNGRTSFTVKIPLGKAHLKTEETIPDYQDSESISEYSYQEEDVKTSEVVATRSANVLANTEGSPVMLIVEDNKEVMAFLREHFEEKFQVHAAFDGEEGIEKAIEIIPDIIISDVMMPKTSGTALCKTLKTDNRTSHIPIILLTARTPVIYKIEGFETGADDYITKPFHISIVEARVWNLLEQRQQLRERYRKEITLQPHNLAITSPDEVFLEKIMAYIEAHIADTNLNVEDLAAEVFMSRTTLYRKIKALTNQTTVDFIRTVRLKRAAQLLKTQAYSISEIAYMTGFTEVNYFRKCFKEQFNATPTEYINAKKE
jgi:signal transduction histidine kinase/ligand-binding sensor domain-containing protein/AraC-like DNA-binding protein